VAGATLIVPQSGFGIIETEYRTEWADEQRREFIAALGDSPAEAEEWR
jgi:hypothetical protein